MRSVFMSRIIDKTTFKFLLVGVINTLVGSGTMFFAYNALHLSYWVSSALNYIVGSLVSYFLNRSFTFKSQQRGWKNILRFTVNILCCYLLAYGMAKPIVNAVLSVWISDTAVLDNLAMLCGMGLFVVLNYIGQRYLVFNDRSGKKE